MKYNNNDKIALRSTLCMGAWPIRTVKLSFGPLPRFCVKKAWCGPLRLVENIAWDQYCLRITNQRMRLVLPGGATTNNGVGGFSYC